MTIKEALIEIIKILDDDENLSADKKIMKIQNIIGQLDIRLD